MQSVLLPKSLQVPSLPVMLVVTNATYEAALAQQKSHYELLLAQERAHRDELVKELKAVNRLLAKERDRYRDELWQKREGKPFEQPIEPPMRQQTDLEAFKEFEATLNQDELDLLADWRAQRLDEGCEVNELPGLWLKTYGTDSPLVVLTV